MIFDLAQDFHDAVAAIPAGHPKHRMLELLEEAVRHDIHFIARHATTLFQCMWNTCWWYDCPESAKHCEEAEGGETGGWGAAREQAGRELHEVVRAWAEEKQACVAGFLWLRTTAPVFTSHGPAQNPVVRSFDVGVTLRRVCISNDGTTVAAATDFGLLVFETRTGLLASRCADGEIVLAAGVSSDGRLVAGGGERGIGVWEVGEGLAEPEPRWQSPTENPVYALAVSPDDRWVAAGGPSDTRGYIGVWQLRSGRRLFAAPVAAIVRSLAFSPDSRHLIAGDQAGGIHVFSLEGRREIAASRKLRGSVQCIAFHPGGRRIAMADQDSHEARAVGVDDSQFMVSWLTPILDWWGRLRSAFGGVAGFMSRTGAPPQAVTFLPGGRFFVTGSMDGSMTVRRTASGAQVSEICAHAGRLLHRETLPLETITCGLHWRDGGFRAYQQDQCDRVWACRRPGCPRRDEGRSPRRQTGGRFP